MNIAFNKKFLPIKKPLISQRFFSFSVQFFSFSFKYYNGFLPEITLSNTIIIAITNRMWINPPVAIPVPRTPKNPKAQIITKITAMV